MLKMMLCVDFVTLLYKNMIVMQKWRFVYLLVKLKKQRFSGLLSQTRPCDSNIS